ncbi:MAG: TolC family protein [Bdellovibrionales bacterium]|nr:TolC family protein [Bdellovibrionales bacterium]
MKNWMALSGLLLSLCVFYSVPTWASNSQMDPSGSRKIKFEDLPNLVLERNENVEAAQLHLKAQKNRIGRLVRSFLPQVSTVAGQEQFKSGSGSTENQDYWKLEATVSLYKGGRDKLENKIRDSNLNLSQTLLSVEYQKELKEARLAYWKVMALTQQIEDRKEALKINELSLKSAKKRAGAGLTTTADAKQFELHRISLEREITKLKLEKDLSLNQLAVALALDEHENIELDSEFPRVTAKDFQSTQFSSDQHLTVKAQKDLEKIEQLKADQSSSWWQPKLDLYAGYGLPSLSDSYERATRKDKEWTAGVRVTIDLGQGFEDRTEALARQAESASFRKRAAHAVREGQALNHELKHDLNTLGELIKTADQDVQIAESFLRLTENEYNRGVKNGPDLLEAVQKYFEFRDKRTDYYRDFYSTQAEIESLVSRTLPNENESHPFRLSNTVRATPDSVWRPSLELCHSSRFTATAAK